MTEKILRRRMVEERVGLSRSTIYVMMAQGKFPKALQIGKRAVGWPESVIREWIASRGQAGE